MSEDEGHKYPRVSVAFALGIFMEAERKIICTWPKKGLSFSLFDLRYRGRRATLRSLFLSGEARADGAKRGVV